MAEGHWASHEILRDVKPAHHSYKQQAVLSYLQLKPSDFDSRFNNHYTPDFPKVLTRGNQPYYTPIGWFRHALNVQDKYPGDERGLGDTNQVGEWAVAFHGTHSGAVSEARSDGGRSGRTTRVCSERNRSLLGHQL